MRTTINLCLLYFVMYNSCLLSSPFNTYDAFFQCKEHNQTWIPGYCVNISKNSTYCSELLNPTVLVETNFNQSHFIYRQVALATTNVQIQSTFFRMLKQKGFHRHRSCVRFNITKYLFLIIQFSQITSNATPPKEQGEDHSKSRKGHIYQINIYSNYNTQSQDQQVNMFINRIG